MFTVLYWLSYEKQKILMNQQCPSFQFTLVAGAVSGGVRLLGLIFHVLMDYLNDFVFILLSTQMKYEWILYAHYNSTIINNLMCYLTHNRLLVLSPFLSMWSRHTGRLKLVRRCFQVRDKVMSDTRALWGGSYLCHGTWRWLVMTLVI